ncbi:MAG: acyl-CoA dehydrogenase family protein, partial [Acidimicrobiales bacterium]
AIMAFGTEEQKARFLPPIAAGEVIWCQGFSEPDAGSDLASLATRAVPEGDGFVISGQKIWTSYAQMAQWCVLAARVGTKPTDRQEGITMFLVPMDRAGITVRPIASMLGPHHLNEVFFDDVAAGGDEVLGPVGGGWNVIRRALAHERVGIARYARCDRLLSLIGDQLADESLPPSLVVRWARALVQVRLARLLAYQATKEQEDGEPTDATASAARLAVTQCDQSVAELMFEVLGPGGLRDKDSDAPLGGAAEDHWRYAQAATVASGTIEVQRMIVSRALLAGSSRS